MKVVLFCHSLLSCWNHGNAHFLRGVVSELRRRGHRVSVYEPENAWSLRNLVEDHGEPPLEELDLAYPELRFTSGGVHRYPAGGPDLDQALDGADLVVVHEWNDPDLVRAIGRRRARGGRFVLLFHDTHHRAVSAPAEMARFELDAYDGVLAFGESLREIWLSRGWTRRCFTWHEAADTWVFKPRPEVGREGELVWIGNWGDEERTAELHEFLVEPCARLGLRGSVHGVRYPRAAIDTLARAGLAWRGWLPNHRVPVRFAAHAVTVHVPRRPYAEALPGIPTIRMFEALACGIPLVTAPWSDDEGLFQPGEDHLVARNGAEMARHLRALVADPDLRDAIARRGLERVRQHHTCAHRVDQLLDIHFGLAATAPGVREVRA